MTQILIDLPPELHDALQHLAGRDDAAIATILREALHHDLRRRQRVCTDRVESVIEPIKARLCPEFTDASDWHDLGQRLGWAGYRLGRQYGALSLCDEDGHYVCNTAKLGHSQAKLTRRFGRSFPMSDVLTRAVA